MSVLKVVSVFIILVPCFLFAFPSKESLKKDCLSKNPNACMALSMYYSEPTKESIEFFKNACNRKIPIACGLLGAKNETTNFKLAKSYYEQGCAINDGLSCMTLSQVYYQGLHNVQKDSEKGEKYFNIASELLKKNCSEDDSTSCAFLAIVSKLSEMTEISSSLEFPLENIEKICKSESVLSSWMCEVLASYLDENPVKGLNAKSIRLLNIKKREELCNTMNYGCYTLATELKDGKNEITNLDKALNLFVKSCENKYGDGCNDAGIIYDERDEQIKSREFFQKACNLKNGAGCSNIGIMWENGEGGLVNYSEAMKYYLKSAELGYDDATGYMGDLFETLIDADTSDFGFGVTIYGNTQEIDNKVEAYMWYNIAAAKNLEGYAEKRDELKSLLNAKQIMTAQKKALKWMESQKKKSN